jgi:hydrogenase maturation protease
VILTIGYGNPLRSDDAVGHHIAHALQDWQPDVQVITAYQLTPELVEPISQATQVIFIDARIGEAAGTVILERVNPKQDTAAFTHHVNPAALLGSATIMYHTKPVGILISVAGACFDYGSILSPQLETLLPAIIAQVKQVIIQETFAKEETHHA